MATKLSQVMQRPDSDATKQMLVGQLVTAAQYDAIAAAVRAGTKTPKLGERYILTDGPLARARLEWNGESFGGYGSQAIAKSYVGASRSSVNAAGDGTDVVLATLNLPGYIMGPNSKIRIMSDWAFTNSSSTKTPSIRWGVAGSITAPAFTTNGSAKIMTEIANANAFTAQKIINNPAIGAGGPIIDRTADTRSPVSIDFVCKWGGAVAGETFALVGYVIELLP